MTVLRNGLVLAVNTGVSGGIGFAAWAVTAHATSRPELGAATGLVAAMTIGTLVANAGLGSALVHVLPHHRDGAKWMDTAASACVVAAAYGTVAGVLLFATLRGFVPELVRTDTLARAGLLVAGTALGTVALVIDWAFIAERRAALVLARNTVFAVVKLGLIVVLATRGAMNATDVLVVWSLATAFSLAIAAQVLVPTLGRGRARLVTPSRARAQWRVLRRTALGNLGANLGAQLPGYIVPLLIVALLSTTANAYYSSAYMAFTFLSAVSPAVASALFAEGSLAGGWSALRVPTGRAVRFLAVVLPLGALALVVARRLILSLFGPAYVAHAAGLLVLLAIGTVPDAVSNICVVWLRLGERFARATAVNVLIATVLLVSTVVLVPSLGLAGAGWAWIVAQSVGAVAALVEIHRLRAAPRVPAYLGGAVEEP